MDIQNRTPSIRQTGTMNCTFFSTAFIHYAVPTNRLIDRVLAQIDQCTKLPDCFNCSWYVLVNYHQRCDDNQITDNPNTSPLNTNPVSEEFYNGGCHE